MKVSTKDQYHAKVRGPPLIDLEQIQANNITAQPKVSATPTLSGNGLLKQPIQLTERNQQNHSLLETADNDSEEQGCSTRRSAALQDAVYLASNPAKLMQMLMTQEESSSGVQCELGYSDPVTQEENDTVI